MTPEESATLEALLTEQRVLSLALDVEGAPYAALLPFAARADLSALLVHASGLARHAKGLRDGAGFGAVVNEPDGPEQDPLRIPRVMLQGRVRRLAKDGADYASGRSVFITRHPSSEMTFSLGDFELYELVPERGRFVAGFGRALNLSPKILSDLAEG